MNFLFRLDANPIIGYGHLSRCLVLAGNLKLKGYECSFLFENADSDLLDSVMREGYKSKSIPIQASISDEVFLLIDFAKSINAEWIIIDSYKYNYEHESSLMSAQLNLCIIEDLDGRRHNCDILLDQNFHFSISRAHEKSSPVYCRNFIGPEFFQLRGEFSLAKNAKKLSTDSEKTILIFFGGGDPHGLAEIALEAALSTSYMGRIIVIAGKDSPATNLLVERYSNNKRVLLLQNSDNIAFLMSQSFLALGSGGVSTFERLYMNLPSILVSSADNQDKPLQALADANYLTYLGPHKTVTKQDWVDAIESFLIDPKLHNLTSASSLNIATKTKDLILGLSLKLAPFEPSNILKTYEFITEKSTAKYFGVRLPSSFAQHHSYWIKKLSSLDEFVYAIYLDEHHIGNCGLKQITGSSYWEGWIYLSSVSPARAGIGETSFRRLLKLAKINHNINDLYVAVFKFNNAAINMYKKIGFKRKHNFIDLQRNWGDNASEVIFMHISL